MEEICHELARIWTELLDQKNGGHLTRDDLNFIMSKVRETTSARKSHLTSGPNPVSGLASAAGGIERRISGITASINRDLEIRIRRQQAFAKQRIDGGARVETSAVENRDRNFARLAIDEARKSISESDARLHPKVGAVVVKDGKVLSVAHRGEHPANHAEYIALEKKLSDEAVAGATVYTTLEPCTTRNHPKIPCAERLIERKVARVVIGMLDPDDRISGRGQRRLRKAGIVTDFFSHDLMTEVEELNREFIRFCEENHQAAAPPQRAQPVLKVLSLSEQKIATILSYKGKPVTVMNHPKSGKYQGSDSFWPYETIVEDCTPLFVTLKSTAGEQSFPLDQVDVNFDNEKKRLRLQIDRY
jgi:pyrimidine deaminase RibD-like protein